MPDEKVDPYIALRFKDCRLYLIGWVLAVIGSQVQSVAIAWELFQRTHRSMTLGWVGLVQAAPVILLSIPAGQVADWFDRRKIVICTQTCAAACSIGLAVLSHNRGSIGWMYGLLFVGAVFQAMGWPARSALLVHTVPTKFFGNAMTWASSGFQVASVAGPALGGLILIKTVPGAYVCDAALQIAFAGCLLILAVKPVEHASEPTSVRTVLAGRAVRPRYADHPRDHYAGFICGIARWRDVFVASIRRFDTARGVGRIRMAACGTGDRGIRDGAGHRAPPANETGRTVAAVGGGGIRRRDDRVRILEKLLAQPRDARPSPVYSTTSASSCVTRSCN